MWATVVARDGALSTANPFSAVQNGSSVFGLQFSNPVDPGTASKEQLVNQLEVWCQRAEESGILALQEFSRKLRCYD